MTEGVPPSDVLAVRPWVLPFGAIDWSPPRRLFQVYPPFQLGAGPWVMRFGTIDWSPSRSGFQVYPPFPAEKNIPSGHLIDMYLTHLAICTNLKSLL